MTTYVDVLPDVAPEAYITEGGTPIIRLAPGAKIILGAHDDPILWLHELIDAVSTMAYNLGEIRRTPTTDPAVETWEATLGGDQTGGTP